MATLNGAVSGLIKCSLRLCSITPKAGYKSQYSLDKLYPNSTLCMHKPPSIPKSDENKFSGYIPIDGLTLTYSASSGPGGQNVNKVHTKVDVRFHVESAKWLPDKVKPSFLERYKSLMNKDGFLILKSDRTRYQSLNVADCLDKLRFMVREAEKEPAKPSPEDVATNLARHEKATRERLRVKRYQSEIKEGRQAPVMD